MPDTPYFTPDEARTQESALADEVTYPDELIAAMGLAVEEALEHACGVAFTPRTVEAEQHDPSGSSNLMVNWPRLIAVADLEIDGSSVSTASLVVYATGKVYRAEGWGTNPGGVLISYTHGFLTPPGRVKRAAIQLTKRWLVETPVNDRATQLVNPDGTTQWLVTAGLGGNITDIPEANAVINEYGVRANVG